MTCRRHFTPKNDDTAGKVPNGSCRARTYDLGGESDDPPIKRVIRLALLPSLRVLGELGTSLLFGRHQLASPHAFNSVETAGFRTFAAGAHLAVVGLEAVKGSERWDPEPTTLYRNDDGKHFVGEVGLGP